MPPMTPIRYRNAAEFPARHRFLADLPIQFRSGEIDRAAITKDSRKVKVRFSSNTPVERWYGTEILEHGADNVRMGRVKNGAAVLMEHDPKARVGITDDAQLDSQAGAAYATVRFSKTPRGDEAMGEVEDNTLRYLSVGYRVLRWKIEENDDGSDATYRAIDWEPLEVTLTGIPADTTCQTMRSASDRGWPVELEVISRTKKEHDMKPLLDKAPADGGGAPTIDAPAIQTAISKERTNTKAILAIAAKHRAQLPKIYDDANAYIEGDRSASDFGAFVLDAIGKKQSDATEESRSRIQRLDDLPDLGSAIVKHRSFAEGLKIVRAGGVHNFEIECNLQKRATLTTTVAGLTKYERPPGVVTLGVQPLTTAQLFAQGTTENTTVRYLREDTWTNAATALAEEAAYAEMSWDMSEQDAAIKKCGVIARITDEMLNDSQATADYLNARVIYAVQILQDSHLITGDGTSNKITGILSTSGILTQNTNSAGGTPLDSMLIAKTKVRTSGFFQPTAFVVNSTDWQNIQLTKDANGQYLLGGPFKGAYFVGDYAAAGVIWGLPVVETTNITQGTAICGAFSLGAQLWMRAGVNVQMSNSDASDFANGRVAVRCDIRHTLAVYRPTAFCQQTNIPSQS